MKTNSWYAGSSASLIATFLLGVVVGFILRYAWFELRQEKVDAPEIKSGITETTPADSPVAGESETVVPELDVMVQPANLEEIWPARHLIVGIPGTGLDPDSVEMLNHYKPGGVWLRSSNTVNEAQISRLISQINMLAGLEQKPDANPLIVAAQDGGKNRNILQMPESPSYEEIAKFETLESIREAGKATASHARKLGVGMLLSPVLDIFDETERQPSERPYFLGTTPESVTRAGIAYIEGLQETGLLAVAKHYPGIGSAILKEGDMPVIMEDNAENLTATIQVFSDAAAHGVSGILISGVSIPVMDTDMPWRPTSLSQALVREILRRRCSYEGVLIADDMRVIASWSENTTGQNIVAALAAGCDAVLISSVSSEEMAEIINTVKRAVEGGALNKEELELSRQRLDLCRQKLARGQGEVSPEAAPAAIPTQTPVEGEETPTADATPAVVPINETEPAPESVTGQQPEKVSEEMGAQVPESKTEEAVKPAESQGKTAAKETTPPSDKKKIVHTIKQGETLTGIANSYGVTVKDIMEWNKMKDDVIKSGTKLDVFTSGKEAGAAGEKKVSSETNKTEMAPGKTPLSEEKPSVPAEVLPVPGEKPAVPDKLPAAAPETSPAAAESAVTTGESPKSINTAEPAETLREGLLDVEVLPETLPLDTPSSDLATGDMGMEPARSVPPLVPAGSNKASAETASTTQGKQLTHTEVPAVSSPVLDPAILEKLPESGNVPSPSSVNATGTNPPAPETTVAPSVEASKPISGESAETTHTIYVVEAGDTLNKIATKHGVTVQQIIAANALTNPNVLIAGSAIKIPKP